MEIGITLPSFVRGADRAAILEWCRRVDEGPFSSVSVGERIAYPSHELVTTLAFAAAATERVRIVSTVAVLPIHDPVRFAKQMATVDVLSGGRLTVGVGVGGATPTTRRSASRSRAGSPGWTSRSRRCASSGGARPSSTGCRRSGRSPSSRADRLC